MQRPVRDSLCQFGIPLTRNLPGKFKGRCDQRTGPRHGVAPGNLRVGQVQHTDLARRDKPGQGVQAKLVQVTHAPAPVSRLPSPRPKDRLNRSNRGIVAWADLRGKPPL